jgi:predicted peptidase
MNRRQCLKTISAAAILGLLSPRNSISAELTKDDIEFRKKLYTNKQGQHLPYRLFVPLGVSDSTQKYPLILWLHGGGGRGSDNLKQITGADQLGSHFWTTSANQAKFPTFLLAPQCPFQDNWSDPDTNQPFKPLELTMEILASVQKEFPIDPARIYIAGQSMGGLGVWSLLQMYSEMWAAALVLSAYDNFTNIPAIARVPLWVFQGEDDRSVPVDLVRAMMKQLTKAKANLRYTEYRKADHEVWTRAFAEPDLLPWLSSQMRGAPAAGQLGTGAAAPTH